MHLTLDIGNTLIKAHLFQEGALVFFKAGHSLDELLPPLLKSYPQLSGVVVSDVTQRFKKSTLIHFCGQVPVYEVKELKWPFESLYQTPQTLGDDRIGLLSAAVRREDNNAVLVFDAGSCLTMDLISPQKKYLGGSISPGLQMRYKSLNHYTGSLPLVQDPVPNTTLGTSTQSSIQVGVFHGMVHEIEGQIDFIKNKFSALTVILTGGDAERLSMSVKNSIFVAPNFLAEGLDYLLSFNKKRS